LGGVWCHLHRADRCGVLIGGPEFNGVISTRVRRPALCSRNGTTPHAVVSSFQARSS